MGRKIFIGDVHGCYEELIELVAKCRYSPGSDQLHFVGDLINKGPYSREVLEFAYNNHAKVVIGNHELALIKLVESGQKKASSLDVVKLSLGKDLEFWIEWLKQLPTFIEEEDFILVHAGLIPGSAPNEEDREVLTHIRTWDGQGLDLNNENNPAWYDLYTGQKTVIFGHWAKRGLTHKEHIVGLDSGCCYGKELSAYILEENQIVQVKAKRAYVPLSNNAKHKK